MAASCVSAPEPCRALAAHQRRWPDRPDGSKPRLRRRGLCAAAGRPCRRRAMSRRSSSSPARPTSTTGPPRAPWSARRMRPTPRASLSAGRSRRRKFSGRVVVEMLNPSNLFDLNIGWAIQHDEIVRQGDAWVGITAKPIAVVTLKAFDPQRYAPLTGPIRCAADDPKNCTVQRRHHQGDRERPCLGHAHAGRRSGCARATPATRSAMAARARARSGSTPGAIRRPAAFCSPTSTQSSRWSWRRTARRRSMAIIVAMLGGPSPISQCAERIPAGDPRRPIRNAGVPVIHVMSQSDYLGWVAQPPRRQRHRADQYRHYDLAGAGHATPDELWFAARSRRHRERRSHAAGPELRPGPAQPFPELRRLQRDLSVT